MPSASPDLASVDAYFNPHRNATEASRVLVPVDPCDCDPHADVFAETPFPSATECAKCHKQIYEEWAVSNHAYAGLSPMFHRFEDTLNKLAGGTVGYFCLRCHAPVATAMGLP
ncbi:MAG: multiheme c-type cytochrome [Pirellulaceae bacterium]